MKCNIKNRPKPNDFMTEDDCFDAQGYQDRMETHFGSMETELQEKRTSQELEKQAILKAINEDQQMPMASEEVGLRSSYWISGYLQAIKEFLGE